MGFVKCGSVLYYMPMKQSFLFTKTRKDAPKDEVAKNADLLIRAGYIHKEMAGVYSFLPLGIRVINRISNIIREEMNKAGGSELHMTALQDSNLWKVTNRWDDAVVDNWFKTKLKNDTELGLGFTHEEQITNMMRDYIRSFRDLPVYPYQIQTKFRNEARAKSGIMRGREFLMKDMYSFSRTQEEHDAFYEKMKDVYTTIFSCVGLGESTYVTFASGGSFSKYSHEFQTLTDSGEDTIYVDEKKKIALNKEVYNDEVISQLGLSKDDLVEKKAVEVGNIFNLGTRFSEALNLSYQDEKGESHPVVMGSYGIGPGRLMGVIVECFADEKGIVWPENVAPFSVHWVAIADKEGKVKEYADALYEKLNAAGIDTLYDDRDLRAGEKFADSDLIGIPCRAVISEKMMAENAIEVKDRKTGNVEKMTEKAFWDMVATCGKKH